jgi:hypothetical protein
MVGNQPNPPRDSQTIATGRSLTLESVVEGSATKQLCRSFALSMIPSHVRCVPAAPALMKHDFPLRREGGPPPRATSEMEPRLG